MKSQMWMAVLAVGMAGCTGATSREGALDASQDARSNGFAQYVVEAESVLVLDADGGSKGVLTIDVGGAASRTVHFTRPDGTTYDTEVNGPGLPLDAVIAPGAESTVLADPALAGFFEAHALAFAIEGSRAPSNAGPVALDPSVAALDPQCADITFPGSCTKMNTCPPPSANWTYHHYYGTAGSQAECEADCGYYVGSLSGADCYCYTRTSSTYDDALCPAVVCAGQQCYFCYGSYCGYLSCGHDAVQKTRTCTQNGSNAGTCANQANGQVGCTI